MYDFNSNNGHYWTVVTWPYKMRTDTICKLVKYRTSILTDFRTFSQVFVLIVFSYILAVDEADYAPVLSTRL